MARSSLHVKKIDASPTCWMKMRDCHLLQIAAKVCISYELEGKIYEVSFLFEPGYRCDGLSVPRLFQKFLPRWDYCNRIYNWAGAIHDALYANRGFGIFTREQCDDIFRGILRLSGISRFKAGCADKAVEWFAKKHWGDDKLESAIFVTMEDAA